MNLFEEYHQRNGLQCPIIKRPFKKAAVILKADKLLQKGNWLIFNINSKEDQHAPTQYLLSWLIPKRNGIGSSSYFDTYDQTNYIEWEDYEKEIIKASQRIKGYKAIQDLEEAKITTWEIFSYLSDDYISQKIPINLRKAFFKSLDPDFDIQTRLNEVDFVVGYFNELRSGLVNKWDHLNYLFDPNTYPVWYANLMNKINDNSYNKELCDLQSVA